MKFKEIRVDNEKTPEDNNIMYNIIVYEDSKILITRCTRKKYSCYKLINSIKKGKCRVAFTHLFHYYIIIGDQYVSFCVISSRLENEKY